MRNTSGDVAGHQLPERLEGEGQAICRATRTVERWVERHNYEAYEPFGGLPSPLRPFTLRVELFERFLQQAVRQCQVNTRPLVGATPLPSAKGLEYMATPYLRMYAMTGDREYREKAINTLKWFAQHKSPKFREHSWANHFDWTSSVDLQLS